MVASSSNGERLNKFLANKGVASRRQVDQMIVEGRIQINGKPASPGDRVKSRDRITVDGKKFEALDSPRRVLAYNKPEGEICSRSDADGHKTVFDRLPELRQGRWIQVGRLDLNTSGLMLFTTDGELANALMHPSQSVPREYACRVRGEVTEEMVLKLVNGVVLEDGLARFEDVEFVGSSGGQNAWFHVVLVEGKNREVRRLWEAVGATVSRLERVRFGNVTLSKALRPSDWQELDQSAVDKLATACNQPIVKVPPPLMKAEPRGRDNRRKRR